MEENDGDAAWFIAQLKPNGHRLAERNLARQGFRSFLPLHEETRRSRGRFVTQLRPLFPGYIFVAFDAGRGHWRAVNSTVGITSLVRLGPEPAPVPNDLIAGLMARCGPDGALLAQDDLAPGDRVVLSKGPFADVVGTIEKIAPDRRIWVLIEAMGRETRLAVSPQNLQRQS